jgi:hypothetical protein
VRTIVFVSVALRMQRRLGTQSEQRVRVSFESWKVLVRPRVYTFLGSGTKELHLPLANQWHRRHGLRLCYCVGSFQYDKVGHRDGASPGPGGFKIDVRGPCVGRWRAKVGPELLCEFAASTRQNVSYHW